MRPAGLKAQKGAGVRDPIRGARRGTAGRWCNDRLNLPGSIVPKIGNNSSRCCSAFGKAQFQDDATAGRMYGDKEEIPWT